nr:MAG TPA: hypothetical protein [Caudoviricetes sp.]
MASFSYRGVVSRTAYHLLQVYNQPKSLLSPSF